MGRGSGQSLFSAFPQVGGLLRYDVAQREPLRVTEPAHLFRRGGSLRFTIASLESLAPTIHACCPTHSSSTDEISSISSVVIFTRQPILRPNGFF